MLHPNTELRLVSPSIGHGVFATSFLPKGTITWVQDPLDQVLTPDRFARLSPELKSNVDKYSFVNRDGDRVLCWDVSKFMNHSCDASALSPGLEFEMAVRDIEAGEEITGDYGSYNLEAAFVCDCGTPACRGTIAPADFDALAPMWDGTLRAAFVGITSVEQPLWGLLKSGAFVRRAVLDPTLIPSISAHRFHHPHTRPRANGADRRERPRAAGA